MDGSFYDKIINVYFFNDVNGVTPDQSLICKPQGYKPRISLSGSILPNSLYTHLELRITNASINFDATTFKKISIDAGYTGPVNAPTKFMATGISGNVTQAYTESPGPDGVTVFIVLIGSEAMYNEMYTTNTENGNQFVMPWGSTYFNIVQSFLQSCQGNLTEFALYTVNMATELATLTYGDAFSEGPELVFYGTVSDILTQMINVKMGLNYSIKNNSISVFSKEYSSSTKAVEIDRFSSTPSIRVKGHINFQSPWIPGLYPGDFISVRPEFMRMAFGGWQTTSGSPVSTPSFYNVLKIDFDFSTIDNTNLMIVDALSSQIQIPGALL